MSDLQLPELDHILDYLQEQTGLNFSANHSSMIIRRLQGRLTKTSQASYPEYLAYLKQHNTELTELQDALTINVTRFFRDSFTFEYFNHQLLPEIFVEKKKSRYASLRIWSAGCASGEEAYSMAILIKEYLEKENQQISTSIFATDIDKKALEAARAGVYSTKSVLDVKYQYLQKYFIASDRGLELKAEIKNMVDFSFFDMLGHKPQTPSESIYGGFDVVLCRNLLIYFQADFQEIIIDKLYQSLNKNGFLILGESERILGKLRDKFHEVSNLCRIYRKL
ncbi:MAG: protein-glutamate O-methyltransferase CheR [Candidatus Marinimicrobia bacterium]|nr:protein-glutamate O-methyltransferase CheR [Candidatus Neomarinimicrobiota bacterium]